MASEENRRKSFARRNKYKELLELFSKIESTTENESPIQTLKNVAEVVKRTDEIHTEGKCRDRVENSSEGVMDAQIIKGAHEIVGTVVQQMDNVEISDDEIVAAIHRTIGPIKDWDKLNEKLASGMSKTITYSQPLFGTFDGCESVIPEKAVKERRKRPTTKNSQQMKPSAVIQQRKQEQEAVSVNVVANQIVQLYEDNNYDPLPYYRLIIDPKNFMRTIQNAFQISFLLRDGSVAIEEDESGYPTVRPMTETDKEENADGGNFQMVSNLSTTLCDEMIQRYAITEPMIRWTDSHK